jgi:hypothetical protein
VELGSGVNGRRRSGGAGQPAGERRVRCTSAAARLPRNCSSVRAAISGMTGLGCCRTQEMATCAAEQPISREMATTSRTMSFPSRRWSASRGCADAGGGSTTGSQRPAWNGSSRPSLRARQSGSRRLVRRQRDSVKRLIRQYIQAIEWVSTAPVAGWGEGWISVAHPDLDPRTAGSVLCATHRERRATIAESSVPLIRSARWSR